MSEVFQNVLRRWQVGQRIAVVERRESEPPLCATVKAIADDLSCFLIKWDHSGISEWQYVEKIGDFQLIQ